MPDFAVVTAFRATDRMSPAFNKMGASSERFGRRATASFGKASMGANMLGNAFRRLGPLIGGAAIFRFAQKSSELFNQQASAIANVEAGLKSTQGIAGKTLKQLTTDARNFQDNTFFGDETILQNATAQILTFTNITGKNFDRTQQASLDLTAKLKGLDAQGTDMRASSILLGKALNDPVANLGALGRVGIQFSTQQKAMIKQMAKGGDIAGAQTLILGELERQYGGTAAALAKTAGGMEIAAKNKMGDTMEKIGAQIVPLRKILYDFALAILPKINEALPVFVKFIKAIGPFALAAATGFLLYKVALYGVIAAQAVMVAAGWIKYLFMMREFITAVTIKQWLWNAAMAANPAGLIALGILAIVGAVILLIKYWDEWGATFSVFLGPVGMLVSYFKTLYDQWEAIKMAFTTGGIIAGLKALGLALFDAMIAPFRQLWGMIKSVTGIGSAEAPNKAEAAARNQNVNVNISNRNVETEAEVTPRAGAQINYAAMGAQ